MENVAKLLKVVDEQTGRLILHKDHNTGRWIVSLEYGIDTENTVSNNIHGQSQDLQEAVNQIVNTLRL